MANIGLEYRGVSQIRGPIIVVENVRDVGYDELVEVKTEAGEKRLGKVIEVTKRLWPSKFSKALWGCPLPKRAHTSWASRLKPLFR